MNVRRESHDEIYDCIVIGSGMGGLSAAGLLAKAGKKVLVVERHDRPGGYAHSFQRKKYIFDAAVHLIGDCHPDASQERGFITAMLQLLDVSDQCTFVRDETFYTALFPDFRFVVMQGFDEFIRAHEDRFPGEGDGFRRLVRLCREINAEVRKMPSELSWWDVVNVPFKFPNVFRYRTASLRNVLNEHLHDERAKAVFATLWGYLGLPPSQLSFVGFAVMLMSFVEGGAYYCQGGFGKLVAAFVKAIEMRGGEVLLRSPVRKILVDQGKVSGIMLEHGQRILAPMVISNADVTQTFEEMVGVEHMPGKYMRDLRRLRQALSALVLYTAIDRDPREFGLSHETMVFSSWDHEATFRKGLVGTADAFALTAPSMIDSSLAPAGEYILTAMTLIPYDLAKSWRTEKELRGEELLGYVEQVMPGLRQHITFAEGASPRTLERYTLNMTGAIYGWEQSIQQTGMSRPGHRTPIKGLFLSGHWTQPSGGVVGVMASGLQTAQIALEYPSIDEMWKALEARAS